MKKIEKGTKSPSTTEPKSVIKKPKTVSGDTKPHSPAVEKPK
jgi:hypothetical protein